MIATESPTFSCDECGKTYRWKQELAGRKVRCKCGERLIVDGPPRGLIAEGFAAIQEHQSRDEELTTPALSSTFIGRLTGWWK
jgi:DNA-directed RNA polymerase subunit RPC12/RpoP